MKAPLLQAAQKLVEMFRQCQQAGIVAAPLQCNLAYFIPSIPILALQFLFDEWADARFGKFRSNCWRAVVGEGTRA